MTQDSDILEELYRDCFCSVTRANAYAPLLVRCYDWSRSFDHHAPTVLVNSSDVRDYEPVVYAADDPRRKVQITEYLGEVMRSAKRLTANKGN